MTEIGNGAGNFLELSRQEQGVPSASSGQALRAYALRMTEFFLLLNISQFRGDVFPCDLQKSNTDRQFEPASRVS